MPWSPVQRQRLEIEKAVLDKYCDDRVSWRDPTGNARVEVRVVFFKCQRKSTFFGFTILWITLLLVKA